LSIQLLDLEPAATDDESEILAGLSRDQKEISPKYFYDQTGSRLFDEICKQPEYYPTRTEVGIMQAHVHEMAGHIGPRASIIEFGSGSSIKTRLLLDNFTELAAYVPVDISREHLVQAAEQLAQEYPHIEVLPVCADFTQPFDLPQPQITPRLNMVFFPGSTIGNFSEHEAQGILSVMREEARDDGALLIGVDLEKPRPLLERAYNDAAGVTADFNLNLLTRLNEEHAANFDVALFEHNAIYDDQKSRIEMRLVSLTKQSIEIAGEEISMDKGEYIVTEHSHKYSREGFAAMANAAGFEVHSVWTDPKELFSVQYLEAA